MGFGSTKTHWGSFSPKFQFPSVNCYFTSALFISIKTCSALDPIWGRGTKGGSTSSHSSNKCKYFNINPSKIHSFERAKIIRHLDVSQLSTHVSDLVNKENVGGGGWYLLFWGAHRLSLMCNIDWLVIARYMFLFSCLDIWQRLS